MKTVRINRKKWIRGPGDDFSKTYLWDKDRKAGCCLGHVCKQISRKTEAELDMKAEPENVFTAPSLLTIRDGLDGLIDNNDFANTAMNINDGMLEEKEREKQLIALFKKNGIKLTFYN